MVRRIQLAAATMVALLAATSAGGQEAGYLPGPLPGAPVLGRSVWIEPMAGVVTFRRRSMERHVRLRRRIRVPLGTIVDARRGRVRLTVAVTRSGRRERSVFYGGKFVPLQRPAERSVTTLRLIGGDFGPKACPPRASRVPAADRRRRIRRLWGDGKGRFRTRGRYSAATVRGTRWLVEDRCQGTLTRVARGEVEVEDFTAPDETQAAPAPPPADGSQPAGAPAPAASPERAPRKPRRVRVRTGGTFVAGPTR